MLIREGVLINDIGSARGLVSTARVVVVLSQVLGYQLRAVGRVGAAVVLGGEWHVIMSSQ